MRTTNQFAKLRKTELTLAKGWEQQTAEAIAKVIVVLLAILTNLLRLIALTLFKFKRQLYKMAILIFVVYGLTSFFMTVTYAPHAAHAMDGKKPFITHTDLRVKDIVLSMARIEFGKDQVKYVDYIVSHESGFDPKAVNPNGGACGLFQSLPCGKMLSMSIQDQVQFGFNYLKNRYGTPANAAAFWRVHNWY